MITHSSETMVVAVTILKSLEVVCDYAFSLVQRSGKNRLIFILLVYEKEPEFLDRAAEEEKLLKLFEKGKAVNIEIKHRVVRGRFPEKVAECLYHLDCPLLVVGEGANREKRLKELKEVETILKDNKAWHHRKLHHFLVVSKRRKDPVLMVFNRKHREKRSEEKGN